MAWTDQGKVVGLLQTVMKLGCSVRWWQTQVAQMNGVAILCAAISICGGSRDGVAGEVAGPLFLQNTGHRVEVDAQHGRLLRLVDRKGEIDLKSRAEQAENFRLRLPLPEDAHHCVYGKDQKLSRVETSADTLELHWDGPLTDARGVEYDLAVTMWIELRGEAVQFRFAVTNRTQLQLREVWYPAIGGLMDFARPNGTNACTLNPPPHTRRIPKRSGRFTEGFGQHLVGYPSQNMGFVQIHDPNRNRGLYLGAHDPVDRFKGFLFLEQGQGDDADVTAWLIHYPFTPPGGTFVGAPYVTQFHDGDWVQAGRDIYRPWFIRTFGLMKPEDDWIRQNSFFQMIMIMLPEGNVNYTIKQIPQLARDGLKYGLTSLQIAGWQRGGHDNGYPYYEPDPRLGTWDDLKRALSECHKLGVKVYFFANLHVNNLDTEWYQRELKNYDFEMMSGHATWVDGWGMGTLASRMKLTTPLMAFADASFPGLADKELSYFKRLAEVGADGLHLDKCYQTPLDFNPRSPLSPDRAPWEGTTRLAERITRECRAIHPDFRISWETTYDRLLSYGAATWWAGNMSVARRIFPELAETVGLYQPYDYLGVNDAVRNGYAVMVAPYQFNRSMDCEPWRGLAGYIRDVKKIRDELADYVFTGEQLDPGEVAFGDGEKPASIEYAVYRNLKNRGRACILTNRGSTAATANFAGFSGDRLAGVRVYRPGQSPARARVPVSITVESERIVFVVED